MRNPQARPGLTLIELMLVLTLLIILAAAILPSFSAIQGNSHQKAGADLLRGRIADARGLAMEHGVPYRLAVHTDGKRIRLAPDTTDFAETGVATDMSATVTAIEQKLDREGKVTAAVTVDAEDAQPVVDGAGWETVATFLPDGTCREDNVILEIHETNFPAIRIRIRGVTGSTRVIPANTGTGTNGGAKP